MRVPRRKPIRFHGLKRPKVRQDMKKETLYNLSRMKPQHTGPRTFFQQKWTAKSISRAYHGFKVREKQWQRLFSRTANAVVPMNAKYLADHDGSEMAAGRGSGKQLSPGVSPDIPKTTPYMQMVYHPLERRLDTAIFRALFASSAKQARQFVVHGGVRVNGRPMRHPSYMLNPGDLFQVDPEKVLYALGEKKRRKNSVGEVDPLVQAAKEKERIAKIQESAAQLGASPEAREENQDTDEIEQARQEFGNVEEEDEGAETAPADGVVKTRNSIKSLRVRTKSIIDDPKTKEKLSAKQKQSVRALAKSLKTAMSKPSSTTPSDLDDWEAQLQSISANLRSDSAKRRDELEAANAKKATDGSKDSLQLTPQMKEALEKYKENPVNAAKPYLTPWRPRPYMSAFAFIPRYLEVNQNICSAVYLRHPVCYPGFAEVPTPFSPETGQLAYTWYLRRR